MSLIVPFSEGSQSHASVTDDDSPYPEVRAAVANTDDPDMPCATFRAWLVGLIWAIIIPGLDQFFFFRYPSVTITGVSLFPSTDFIVY